MRLIENRFLIKKKIRFGFSRFFEEVFMENFVCLFITLIVKKNQRGLVM